MAFDIPLSSTSTDSFFIAFLIALSFAAFQSSESISPSPSTSLFFPSSTSLSLVSSRVLKNSNSVSSLTSISPLATPVKIPSKSTFPSFLSASSLLVNPASLIIRPISLERVSGVSPSSVLIACTNLRSSNFFSSISTSSKIPYSLSLDITNSLITSSPRNAIFQSSSLFAT